MRAQMHDAPDEQYSYKIKGRCLLESGDEFECDIWKVAVSHAAVIANRHLELDEAVICYIDDVGVVAGKVSRAWKGGFIVRLDVKEERRQRLEASVRMHEQRASAFQDQRSSPRIIPIKRDVQIWLAEDVPVKGLIFDLSRSGVSIILERQRPFIGSLIVAGKRLAKVVRHREDGFAAQFIEPISDPIFTPTFEL